MQRPHDDARWRLRVRPTHLCLWLRNIVTTSALAGCEDFMAELNHERQWQQIARELSQEYDPAKVLELSKELHRALEEQLPNSQQALGKPA
jgi:hypothetical protein